MAMVFETLVSTDSDGNLVPQLCEKWETLGEGALFHFELRPNIRLHDGRRLTAQMIKASVEQALRYSSLVLPAAFASIQGVDEFVSGSAPQISGIVIRSEHSLEIQLKEKLAIFPALLTDPRTSVAALPDPDSTSKLLAGTGPFRLSSWGTGSIRLERNSEYWKKRQPFLDGIELRVGLSSAELASEFRAGKLDLVRDLLPEDLEEILRSRTLHATLVDAPQKNVCFIIFNTNSKVGKNRELRLALGETIRRHDLVRSTLGRFAQPAECLIPPGILGHDPGKRSRPKELEEAKELLKASGLQFPLKLRASVHPILQDRYSSFLKALFHDWSKLDVTIEIMTNNVKSYNDTWEKNEGIDLLIGRWIADYGDPDNFSFGLFNSNTGHFRKYYSTAIMDELVAKARTEMRPEERERQYREMERHLLEEGILFPLFHDVGYRIANPKLRNVSLSSSPPYVNYDDLQKSETFAAAPITRMERGVLQVPMAGDVESLDPALTATMPQAWTLPAVFETLTRAVEGARIIPWLASSFHAEQGGRRFRFHLRDGVRFHDGRRMTSRDVRYSFERLLHSNNSNSQALLSPIRGAKDVMKGRSRELEGFRILSAQDFLVELEQPLSFFPALLTYTPAAIIPEGTDPVRGSWREGCLGTGPFRVTSFDPQRRLRVEANPGYWRQGFPRAGEMEFVFGVAPSEIYSGFRKGDYSLAFDLLPSDVEKLLHETEFAAKYKEIPSLSTYYISLNVHKGPFTNENLRHKLVRALNIPAMIRRTAGRLAVPAYSLTPPALLGYEPGPTNVKGIQDPGKQDAELSVAMHSVYHDQYQPLLKEVFGTLEQLGFRVKLANQRAEYSTADESESNDLILMRFYADYPDADTFLSYLLHTQSGLFGRTSGGPELDRLIAEGRTEIDPRTRHSIYQQIEELIANQARILPLFHVQTYCFSRPEVDGLSLNYFIPILPFEELAVRR
jgi:ABC-type transport system substrate-binding protein